MKEGFCIRVEDFFLSADVDTDTPLSRPLLLSSFDSIFFFFPGRKWEGKERKQKRLGCIR